MKFKVQVRSCFKPSTVARGRGKREKGKKGRVGAGAKGSGVKEVEGDKKGGE